VRTACAVKYFSRQGTPAAAARGTTSSTAAVKHTRAHSHGGLYRNGRRCNRRNSAECQRKAHVKARSAPGSACGGRDNLLQTVNTVNLRRANQPFNCRFTYMYSSPHLPHLPPHLRPHQPPHVLFARAIGPHLYVHVWKDTWPTTCGTQAVDRQTAGRDATKTLTRRSPVIWRKN